MIQLLTKILEVVSIHLTDKLNLERKLFHVFQRF